MKNEKKLIIKMILLIIFNFIFFSIVSGEGYESQTDEEKRILNRLRKADITIGIYKREFYNRKSIENNMSINDIIMNLFSDYLGLNVNYKKGELHRFLEGIEKGEIQGISMINKYEERKNLLNFSDSVYENGVYIVSSKKRLSSINELEGEKLYISSRYLFREYIENILLNNNIQSEIIEVNNIFHYEDEIIITDIPVQFNSKYAMKISNSSNGAIGLTHDLDELMPILNKALSHKYKELINRQVKLIEEEMALENFYSDLSMEELKYLNNLKKITISYNRDTYSNVQYYSKSEDEMKGIIPDILEIIGEALGIQIDIESSGYSENFLETEKQEVHVLSKTKNRSRDMVFTEKIYDNPIYMVSLKNKDNDDLIGVIGNSIEEEVEKKYTLYQNIKRYSDYTSLIKALDRGEVQRILTTNISQLNTRFYDVQFFEYIPVSLAFQKEDVLLRNIIDKAIFNLVSLDDVITNSILEKVSNDQLVLAKENQKKRFFIALSCGLFLLLTYASIKIKNQKKYKQKLLKDPISGLPNRIMFNDFCSNEVEIEGYVFILRLNGFENINDIYYHRMGDKIIHEFAKFLRETFKGSKIFKITGEEFHGIIAGKVDEFIEALEGYKDHCPTLIKNNITYCLGVYYKKKRDTMENAFKYANMAMFEAREKNGDSFYITNNEFIELKNREENILLLLNGDMDEFFPVFQPKIDLFSDEVIGMETLARCTSERLGAVSPGEFIPIAENHDLIHRIDYKMAEESIRLLDELIELKKIEKGFRISFNLSSKTFAREDLLEVIEGFLLKYGVSGDYIEIEITESLLIKDMGKILKKLDSLINLGIQISLDDFTAGYSTASLLPILPINIVKFDRSLLDSIGQNSEKAEIVYLRLVSLMKDLDIKIVAEGIEEMWELDFLKKYDVDYGQGYLIGRPEKEPKLIFVC